MVAAILSNRGLYVSLNYSDFGLNEFSMTAIRCGY